MKGHFTKKNDSHIFKCKYMSRCTVIRTFWVFFLNKLLWGPRRSKIRDFCYNWPWPTIFWGPYVFGPPRPPYMARNAKMCYFEHFLGVRWKNHPKVEARREKFNIGNFPHIFFMALYICWDYVISFSQHFPMKKFSPSLPTSPSPESGAFFEILIRNGNKIFKIIL